MALVLVSPPAAHAFIYWASSTEGIGTIGRANVDASAIEKDFAPANACGVAVDARHLYTANGFSGSIERRDLDGSDVDSSFITGATYPCGVAVDSQHIYWANGAAGPGGTTIGRANLDGTHVDQSFITGADNPSAVAVDGTYIYWANRSSQGEGNATIGRAKLDGTSVDESFITGASSPCGIAVDGGHVYWTNQPVLSQDGYTTYEINTIGRANLDGTSPNQDFITGPTNGAPVPPRFCGLAVSGSHVYWDVYDDYRGSSDNSSISRANLDGSDVDDNFITGVGASIHGVAVDSLTASATTLAPAPTSIRYGQPMSFTATVARVSPAGGPPTPTGTVEFTVTGEPPVALALGASGIAGFDPDYYLNVGDTVTATYTGDFTYGASSTTITTDIQPAHTSTSLTLSPNPAHPADDVTLIASIANTSTKITPFGSVQFVINGEPIGEPQPLDENGETGLIISGFDPGSYLVEAQYHDDTGDLPNFSDSRASMTERISSPPQPTPTPTATPSPFPAPDTAPPVIRSASATPRRFAIDPRGLVEVPLTAARAGRGTTFRYSLSEASRVVFTLQRMLQGRKVRGRCRRPSETNRHKPQCTRYVPAGGFAVASIAGANSKRFSGRIGKRSLKPGRYRVSLVATDAAGNRSDTKWLTVQVVVH